VLDKGGNEILVNMLDSIKAESGSAIAKNRKDPCSPVEEVRSNVWVSLVDIGAHLGGSLGLTLGKWKRVRGQRTEVIIIHMLVVYVGCPILSYTFDLEDGFLAGGSIVIDTLEANFCE